METKEIIVDLMECSDSLELIQESIEYVICKLLEIYDEIENKNKQQPKAPTFKDVFLSAFPNAETVDNRPALCVRTVFPYVEPCEFTAKIEPKCKECWNQPYFEEDGGEE